MHTVYFDSQMDDATRRHRLYEGQIFAYSARSESEALCTLARRMIEDAFNGLNPLLAQFHMPVEEFVSIAAPLKPRFIHAPETKQLLRGFLKSMGCDMDKTYLDVPRLRIVTHGGYLTSGVGYAHHPHRDTWYSAPMCQLNWWLPIYELESESSMAFHPEYWARPLLNDSHEFNYYEWNKVGRSTAAQHIRTDTRRQPKPQESMTLEPQVRLVTEPGGIVLFSAAQMHSTVPNTSSRTRFSIDFRTVHFDDVVNQIGAPNVDSRPTGTSLRDFMRCSDFERMPDEVAQLCDGGPPTEGVLVYAPKRGLETPQHPNADVTA
jgi:hypothetical protein